MTTFDKYMLFMLGDFVFSVTFGTFALALESDALALATYFASQLFLVTIVVTGLWRACK